MTQKQNSYLGVFHGKLFPLGRLYPFPYIHDKIQCANVQYMQAMFRRRSMLRSGYAAPRVISYLILFYLYTTSFSSSSSSSIRTISWWLDRGTESIFYLLREMTLELEALRPIHSSFAYLSRGSGCRINIPRILRNFQSAAAHSDLLPYLAGFDRVVPESELFRWTLMPLVYPHVTACDTEVQTWVSKLLN